MPIITFSCVACGNGMRANIDSINQGKNIDSYTCAQCRKVNLLEFSLTLKTINKSYKDRKWLFQKYDQERLTQQQVADICGVSPMTIGDWLKKHEIDIRPRGISKD